jgi:serine O-acetyltransferase
MEPSTIPAALVTEFSTKPAGQGLWESIQADRRAYGYTSWSAVYELLTISTWGLVLSYRVAHWLAMHKVPVIPGLLHAAGLILWGSDISPAADIGAPLRIAHSVGIVIGAGCTIGSNCQLFQNVTLGRREGQDCEASGQDVMPVIGNHVTLCAGAVVIGPIRVGDGAIVGANAVVLRDVPPYTAVAGVPAKPIRHVDVPHAVNNLPAKWTDTGCSPLPRLKNVEAHCGTHSNPHEPTVFSKSYAK